MATLVSSDPTLDGNIFDIYDDGIVTRGKTEFSVQRQVYRTPEGEILSNNTVLIGKKGARYLLRHYLGDDTGARQMISLGSGAEYRVQGNAIKVIEVCGIIEFLN